MNSKEAAPQTESISSIVSVWEKIIDVQMHFNDIELKIRNYALTTFTFVIAAMGFLEKEKIVFSYNGEYNIPAATPVGILGIVVVWCFYFMDKFWYHKLLMGAVYQASEIEKKWGNIIPEIGLTQRISKESPIKLDSKYDWVNSIYKFIGVTEIHSKSKYRIFYYPLFVVLFAFSLGIWILEL